MRAIDLMCGIFIVLVSCGPETPQPCDTSKLPPPTPLQIGSYRSTLGFTAEVTETEVIVSTPSGQQRYRRPGSSEVAVPRSFDRCGARAETFGHRTLEVDGPKILIRAAPGARFLSLDHVTSSFRCLFESCPAIEDARVELADDGGSIEIEQHAEEPARGVSTVSLSWSLETDAGTFTESKMVKFVPADEPVLTDVARCF